MTRVAIAMRTELYTNNRAKGASVPFSRSGLQTNLVGSQTDIVDEDNKNWKTSVKNYILPSLFSLRKIYQEK